MKNIKFWKLLVCVLPISLLFLSIVYFMYFPNSAVSVYNPKVEGNFGELNDGMVIEQSLLCKENNLNSIGIMFGTYKRKNRNKLQFTLLNQNGEVLFKKTASCKKMKDNEYYYFSFDKITDSKDKQFTVQLRTINAEQGNTVTLWTSKNNYYNEGSCKFNGIIQAGDINFSAGFYRDRIVNFNSFLNSINVNKNIFIAIFILLYISMFLIISTVIIHIYNFL